MAAQAGQLELNVMMPLIAYNPFTVLKFWAKKMNAIPTLSPDSLQSEDR